MAVRVTGKPKRCPLRPGGVAIGRSHPAVQGCPAVCLPLAQLTIDPVLLVIGSLIVIGFLLMRFQKRTSQSNAAPNFGQRRPGDKPAGGRADRAAIDNWEVQMHELARELTGRVDTKLAALQQLLLMLDERMVALDEKLARLDAKLAALPADPEQLTPPAAPAKVSEKIAGEATASTEPSPAEPAARRFSAADSDEVGK